MEGNCAYDQRELQTQLGRARNIHADLVVVEGIERLKGRCKTEAAATLCIKIELREAPQGLSHLEHVLDFDDAALQDGGTHGWDLDGSAVPCLPTSGTYNVSTQRAHHRALLLHGAASDKRLRLNDVGFGHHWSGGRVVKLRKDGYHLACSEGKYVRTFQMAYKVCAFRGLCFRY